MQPELTPTVGDIMLPLSRPLGLPQPHVCMSVYVLNDSDGVRTG